VSTTIDSSFKPESASDLPIDELLEQVAQISAKNPNSATLSTLFDRLGQAYTELLDRSRSIYHTWCEGRLRKDRTGMELTPATCHPGQENDEFLEQMFGE
jgi:hypothetical protein